VSFVSGPVHFRRGDEPRDWQTAIVNVPLMTGDRLHVGPAGRVELELQGGNLVELAPGSDLWLLDLSEGGAQLAILNGRVSISLRRLLEDERFEVDTPTAAATLQQTGTYRVDVGSGRTSRSVFAAVRGQAAVAAGGGELTLAAGHQIAIESREGPRFEGSAIRQPDDWDRWVEERGWRLQGVQSAAHVNSEVVGTADLDHYGRWDRTPDYGNAWTPSNVGPDWQPYQNGHWYWQDPWGWTWISEEPWGWAPYHYGRWASYPSGWFWIPENPTARYVFYSPALVAFLGGCGDGAATVGFRGGDFVGWFPLAYQDPF
jgi:hypothetical protein